VGIYQTGAGCNNLRAQRLLEIGDQIAGVFDADRDSYEAIRNWC